MNSQLSQLEILAVLTTIVLGWWTLTLRTRSTYESVVRDMERQFWINHSVDLPYHVRTTSSSTANIRLVIKGVEVYDNYWWLQLGDRTDPYILANPGEAYRQFKRRVRSFEAKGRYLLYRNLIPYAGIKTEITLLIKPENCDIRRRETVQETEHGTLREGAFLNEAVPDLESMNGIWDGLYKITVHTDDYKHADEVVRQIAKSDFIDID